MRATPEGQDFINEACNLATNKGTVEEETNYATMEAGPMFAFAYRYSDDKVSIFYNGDTNSLFVEDHITREPVLIIYDAIVLCFRENFKDLLNYLRSVG